MGFYSRIQILIRASQSKFIRTEQRGRLPISLPLFLSSSLTPSLPPSFPLPSSLLPTSFPFFLFLNCINIKITMVIPSGTWGTGILCGICPGNVRLIIQSYDIMMQCSGPIRATSDSTWMTIQGLKHAQVCILSHE